MIIGADFAGIVEEVGPGVKGWEKGYKVYGAISAFSKNPGALAELAVVDLKYVRRMPYFMSFEQAASLPIAALTASNGLRRTHTGMGTRVLINGATGGVGHFALQMAKAKGAHVTATCSSTNISLAKDLGAHEIYEYSGNNTLPDGARFDAIIDAWGMMAYKDIYRLLKKDGIYASPLYMPWTVFAALYVRLRYGRNMTSSNMRTLPEDYDELEALLESGSVRPLIENTFPLEKAAEAFDKAQYGRPRGKVIITV
jgi:NADPH:quinone reductase-like Zn-dependent oxidoreductase